MRVLTTAESLATYGGGTFVPTMGALHDGHGSLIRRARELARPVIVSIFVNPTQFGPAEDLSRYPRTPDSDRFIAERAGADVVFMPSPETVYPAGLEIPVPPLPAVATQPQLEDAHRPTHFAGVCQVVARLFDLVRPQMAVFGEKDWQQLKVVEAMVESAGTRWPGLRIIAHPTLREPDGLAMSSRNRYLRPEQRDQALGLARALQAAHAAQHPATAEMLMRDTLEAHGLIVDYAVVRHPSTLLPLESLTEPSRALIAARLEGVRLIDNAPMTVWG